MDPDHSKYVYNLGCCYEALKHKKKAIECYERSLYLDPNGKETIIALSRIKGTPIPNPKAPAKSMPPKAS
jgi:tetratricopeptide (TPR) repeat protein